MLPLDATHAFAFDGPEIELAVIGRRRQVGFVKRNARAMEIDVAADAANTGTQRSIDDYRVCPRFRIMITHVTPTSVIVERASNAGGFRGVG